MEIAKLILAHIEVLIWASFSYGGYFLFRGHISELFQRRFSEKDYESLN